MPEWLQLILLAAGSYLLGAIPSGYLVGRLAGHNILQSGSGKTGVANVLAVVGPGAALAVLALDVVKGIVPLVAARLLPWPSEAWLASAVAGAGAAAILGHNWSAWLRLFTGAWAGGRGIVVALGAMLSVHPAIVLAAVIGGLAGLAISRYAVVATVAGIAVGVLAATFLVGSGYIPAWLLPGTVLWGILVVAGFHDNIARLARGKETRIGRRA